MDNFHKFLMILITIIIDAVFLYILRNEQVNRYEKCYIYVIMLIHIIFTFALLTDNNKIIDLSHIFLFLSIYLGVFIQNRSIIILLTTLSLTQIIFKVLFGGCIMCTKEEQSFGTFADKYNQNFVYITVVIMLYRLFL
jgi:hypothetical protein